MMTFGRGVRNVEGMVEMNAAPVVSPLNSLDCARINVGPGGREREEEEEVEKEVKKKRVAAGKCQYQARVVAKKGRREEWEKGERKKERKRDEKRKKREREKARIILAFHGVSRRTERI